MAEAEDHGLDMPAARAFDLGYANVVALRVADLLRSRDVQSGDGRRLVDAATLAAQLGSSVRGSTNTLTNFNRFG